MIARTIMLLAWLLTVSPAFAQVSERTLAGWTMQDAARVSAEAAAVSLPRFKTDGWYRATVPGTVLTTLVDNKVYPEPLYGENMRAIPESLNKTSYWYRTTFLVPVSHRRRRTWIHFGGINYSAEIWVNAHLAGTMRGAFLRGDFDITEYVSPGGVAAVAVLVAPQPHPGVPHEHTLALGIGKNGGEATVDGPTFLATQGWDWLAAVRDRDTGIWLPVTVSASGPAVVRDPYVTSDLARTNDAANLAVSAIVKNLTAESVDGTLVGTIAGHGEAIQFRRDVTIEANTSSVVSFDSATAPKLHVERPKLWWPNGYGEQNLYTLTLTLEVGGRVSSSQTTSFGIRRIDYAVPDSENLTISVNGVRVMVRGGNWGLDEAMKRIPRARLDAQFHLHALANLNLIRNWVGQSTSPDFYELADKYGMLIWDEFFQPNPNDGPNVTDVPTYLANATDKVLRYRNHPSIAVWCARNEGYPPKDLDDALKAMMGRLDPGRLYQSNSADGRGVSSHGPYYWRPPREFYTVTESFKTETGSMSVPTIESIQGMLPEKDWDTIDDAWAQHDMARGAQHGDTYPATLAKRYGPIRNLADFVRKGQLANYEAFRAMYEGRNAQMFKATTGIITWMSNPAQPSFVWQLYHYDLEPNAALFAVKKAAETVHVQLNEANSGIEIVNNRPEALTEANVHATIYGLSGTVSSQRNYEVAEVAGSSVVKAGELEVAASVSPVYFVKLDLTGAHGELLSTNFYWQSAVQDDFNELAKLPAATLDVKAVSRVDGANTEIDVELHNPTEVVALMTHLQLHRKRSGGRVLPVFYSDNYVSLAPGETRSVRLEVATKDLDGEAAMVLVDGFNIGVKSREGKVSVRLNLNAQPEHWPVSGIAPD
jgi:beta-mannosidase